MELQSRKFASFLKSRPIAPCAQCGDPLFAPEWSEYIDDRRIRHLWSCDRCDYRFETLVCYPARSAAGTLPAAQKQIRLRPSG
jgi:hypothetical protein